MADKPVTPVSQKPTEPAASSGDLPAVKPVIAEAKPEAAVAAKPVEAVKPAEPAVKPVEAVVEAKPEVKPEPVKPAEAVKPVEVKPEEAKPAAAVVPEAYTVKLEGEVQVNADAITALTPTFKELGLSNDGATKLANAFVKYQLQAPARKNEADLAVLRQDPEIGLLNFGRTQAQINDALGAFTTDAERTKLSALGMANDPVLVRMFQRIGAAMSEAPEALPARIVPAPKTTAQKLFGGADLVKDQAKPA